MSIFLSPAHNFFNYEAVTHLCDVIHIGNYFIWKGCMSPRWCVGLILEPFECGALGLNIAFNKIRKARQPFTVTN
jgi:hypothetical protein